MDIKITPSQLSGTLDVISSKSLVHRLLFCAALSEKNTRINLNGVSDDILSTVRCLEAMGCSVKIDRRELFVTPLKKPSPEASPSSVVFHCGESGTTARFIMPIAAHFYDKYTLTGEGKLPQRPFAPLCEALRNAGCTFDNNRLPLVGTGKVRKGKFKIAGNISSQFISGLLLLLPLLDSESYVKVTTPLESDGYVRMTIESMALFGIAVEKGKTKYSINGNRRYDSPGTVTAEGDWSNAAFFLCMSALRGPHHAGEISLRGLSMRSEQGDKEIIELLRRFGATVDIGKELITVKAGTLQGIDIDASQIPDLVPTLAVVASVAEGETKIYNARRLRLKESDRILSTHAMLSSLGADVRTTDDGLIVRGKEKLRGGVVDGAGDHRIVMAAATASCICETPVVIKGFMTVNKSYPGFFGDFQTMGGVANVL